MGDTIVLIRDATDGDLRQCCRPKRVVLAQYRSARFIKYPLRTRHRAGIAVHCSSRRPADSIWALRAGGLEAALSSRPNKISPVKIDRNILSSPGLIDAQYTVHSKRQVSRQQAFKPARLLGMKTTWSDGK
jgi:hypothetical protein